MEHLHGAAGDPVGLAKEQRTGSCSTIRVLIPERPRAAPPGQGRSAQTDDQNVDLVAICVLRTVAAAGFGQFSGSPGLKPFRWNCIFRYPFACHLPVGNSPHSRGTLQTWKAAGREVEAGNLRDGRQHGETSAHARHRFVHPTIRLREDGIVSVSEGPSKFDFVR